MCLEPPIQHQLEFARAKIEALEKINTELKDLLRESASYIKYSHYLDEQCLLMKINEILE